MKKNSGNIIIILSLFVFISGCKKFITKDPVGEYTESQFYQTQAQAMLAINAAYAPLAFTTANVNRLWVFGDVASDDAAKGGNPGDQADIGFIDDFNVNSTNGNLASMWSLLYDGVTRCNLVLAKVPTIKMDNNLQQRILGEAKFLRAYYYFELVNIFGDVPVVLTPLNAGQLQITQSPEQQRTGRRRRSIKVRSRRIALLRSAASIPCRSERTDHQVVTVGIAQCEFTSPGIGIDVGLRLESSRKCARTRQHLVKIVHAEKQKQSVAGFRPVRTCQRRVLMRAPLMKTQQDRSIRVEDLPEVIVSRARFRSTEKRLIPIEAARDIRNANDCPRALHRLLLEF